MVMYMSPWGATNEDFRVRHTVAREEYPNAKIWLKTHPDVLTGKKKAYFDAKTLDSDIRIIAKDVSPQSLLQHVSTVYTVTSQFGIEAFLAGKKVKCFGLPWYAG